MQATKAADVVGAFTLMFTVWGTPKSWQRHIGTGRNAKTPEKTRAHEIQVKWSAKAEMTTRRLKITEDPLVVEVVFYFSPYESWSKEKRRQALANELACVTGNDIDNLQKSLFDGATGVVWKDDRQIVKVIAEHRWAERERTEVTVRSWRSPPDPRAD